MAIKGVRLPLETSAIFWHIVQEADFVVLLALPYAARILES